MPNANAIVQALSGFMKEKERLAEKDKQAKSLESLNKKVQDGDYKVGRSIGPDGKVRTTLTEKSSQDKIFDLMLQDEVQKRQQGGAVNQPTGGQAGGQPQNVQPAGSGGLSNVTGQVTPDKIEAIQNMLGGQGRQQAPQAPTAAPTATPTGYTQKGLLGTTTYKYPKSAAQIQNEVELSWKKEKTKNDMTLMSNFSTVLGLMQPTVSVWKAAAAEKEAKGIPPGLASKIASGVADTLELEGFPMTKAYIGQRIETGLALNKIITGYNRVIKDVFNRVLKTLPTDTRLTEDMEAKVAQSILNSFTRAVGRPLTSDEQQYIKLQSQKVLTTPAMTLPQSGTATAVQKFKTFQIGGENYTVPLEEVEAFINDSEFNDQEMYILD